VLRVVRYIAVESVVGAVIDHILVGRGYAATEVHDEGLLAATLNETDTHYELVHVSADRGLMEVHRRVGSP
jgi:hypothetical protein